MAFISETLQMRRLTESGVNIKTTYIVDGTPVSYTHLAYKSLEDIIDVIRESVDVIDVMKPIYNFKASD